MDKIDPKLRLDYPYSPLARLRRFPFRHYYNNSRLVRTIIWCCIPIVSYTFLKMNTTINTKVGPAEEADYHRGMHVARPFQPVVEDGDESGSSSH